MPTELVEAHFNIERVFEDVVADRTVEDFLYLFEALDVNLLVVFFAFTYQHPWSACHLVGV